jgi:hypothetical protein
MFANIPLDLSLFENINNLSEVEDVLFNNNYLDINNQNKTDFRVNLPTLLTMYADFKLFQKFLLLPICSKK